MLQIPMPARITPSTPTAHFALRPRPRKLSAAPNASASRSSPTGRSTPKTGRATPNWMACPITAPPPARSLGWLARGSCPRHSIPRPRRAPGRAGHRREPDPPARAHDGGRQVDVRTSLSADLTRPALFVEGCLGSWGRRMGNAARTSAAFVGGATSGLALFALLLPQIASTFNPTKLGTALLTIALALLTAAGQRVLERRSQRRTLDKALRVWPPERLGVADLATLGVYPPRGVGGEPQPYRPRDEDAGLRK